MNGKSKFASLLNLRQLTQTFIFKLLKENILRYFNSSVSSKYRQSFTSSICCKKNLKMFIKSSFCFALNISSNCHWKRPQAWLMSNPATLWWYIIDNFLLHFQRKMKRKNKTLIREVNWNLSFVLSLSDNKAEHNNEVGATSQSAYRFRNMTPIMYKKGQWVH